MIKDLNERLNERFKTKTKEGINSANYEHALRFIELLRSVADGVTNKKEFTGEYLKDYFSSKGTKDSVIKVLKEEGVIEVTKSYTKGVKGKEYRLHNDYLPEDLKSKYMINPLDLNILLSNPNRSVDEDVFFNTTPGPEGFVQMFGEPTIQEEPKDKPIQEEKEYTFLYKGFKEFTRVITIQDKEIIKEIKYSLGESFLEAQFIDECLERGIDKEKAWFFYSKLKSK